MLDHTPCFRQCLIRGHFRPSLAGFAYPPLPLRTKSGHSAGAALMSTRRRLVHPSPTFGGEPLLRPEAALVVHLARASDPVAEIDVRQSHAPRARDVVEDHK